jgi:Fe-S-cluster-containing hydrogenase component 2
MLIDLDRCTRCDECVQACVKTHDDGRSRLFLTGPRFDRYVVPTTCRSCLDPVGMIGCPVGSIHRGGNGQIEIEDWCIGCARCARQCPYGAIQMHDIGAMPEGAHGWRFRPAGLVGKDWFKPGHRDSDWAAGRAPFFLNRTFQEELSESGKVSEPGRVCFRRAFDLDAAVQASSGFTLELISPDAEARVWLNGVELQTDEKVKRNRRLFPIAEGGGVMRARKNVLAAQVRMNADAPGEVFFDVRIDQLRRLDAFDVEIRQVASLAVVCDLCTDLRTGPACVTACPHEAALRVDARSEFPGQA